MSHDLNDEMMLAELYLSTYCDYDNYQGYLAN